jgi:hypothetical protein
MPKTMAPPATPDTIDLPACRHLAAEVRSTEALIRVVDDLVGEILDRLAAHEREIGRIHGGDDPYDSPSRMDLILNRVDTSGAAVELLEVADRIMLGLDNITGRLDGERGRFLIGLHTAGVDWDAIRAAEEHDPGQ